MAFGVALLATAAPGQAQPKRGDTAIIETIDESDLVALVQAEGYTVDEITSTSEEPSIRGKTPDGVLFELYGAACDEETGRCYGLEIDVKYDPENSITADKMVEANMTRMAIKAYWDREGDVVGLTQYIILDGGVTWKNLRENLRITLEVQDAVRAALYD